MDFFHQRNKVSVASHRHRLKRAVAEVETQYVLKEKLSKQTLQRCCQTGVNVMTHATEGILI